MRGRFILAPRIHVRGWMDSLHKMSLKSLRSARNLSLINVAMLALLTC